MSTNTRTPHPARFRWAPNDIVFPLAVAAIHAALWWWSNLRLGVWQQVPSHDQSHDLRVAWILWRAIENGDLPALVDGWMHSSPVHTPLVPFASAIMMAIFGESRVVAEAVLPLATAVWLVATYAVIATLYDRRTARMATALVTAFPLFLIYSRTYFFEHPLAAFTACACWGLLATDGFQRRLPSLGFGVLAGLTALARGGGFVFLVGPVIVLLTSVRHAPDWRRRLGNAALATGICAAVMATWYLPNIVNFAMYVYRVSYGADAALYTAEEGALSWETFSHYVTWIIAQGPGVPMAAVACAGWLATSRSRKGGGLGTPTDRALAAVFAIDFLLVLTVGQRLGTKYFQPLMPLIAVAIVRAVRGVPNMGLRRILGWSIVALALHHLVGIHGLREDVFEPRPYYVAGVPLWDHQPHALGMPHEDLRVPETIGLLAALDIPEQARIALVSTAHGYYSTQALQFEAVRQGRTWEFVWSYPFDAADPGSAARALPSTEVDAILVRSEGPTGFAIALLHPVLPALFDANRRIFDRVDQSVELGDGSVVTVFKRQQPPWTVDSPLPSALRLNADGTSWIRVHPAAASSVQKTRVVLSPGFAHDGVISSRVWFPDARCKGIEISRLIEGVASASSLGFFSPAANDAILETTFTNLEGRQLSLIVGGIGLDPGNVNFCTVVLKDVNISRR